ncbi:hypothetical protein [Flammeovirga aprica]|uniref:Uncharacterized protein n=1 Tax=Flammeovirga aprica JL-4 TaxID=694437 RepID=A0A7X9RUS7_9BACT|nr:hypothetical protein [Flammeovirga aprica]NME69091.1 hypothetical protein [Flammeovirga aprica JL-4]
MKSLVIIILFLLESTLLFSQITLSLNNDILLYNIDLKGENCNTQFNRLNSHTVQTSTNKYNNATSISKSSNSLNFDYQYYHLQSASLNETYCSDNGMVSFFCNGLGYCVTFNESRTTSFSISTASYNVDLSSTNTTTGTKIEYKRMKVDHETPFEASKNVFAVPEIFIELDEDFYWEIVRMDGTVTIIKNKNQIKINEIGDVGSVKVSSQTITTKKLIPNNGLFYL